MFEIGSKVTCIAEKKDTLNLHGVYTVIDVKPGSIYIDDPQQTSSPISGYSPEFFNLVVDDTKVKAGERMRSVINQFRAAVEEAKKEGKAKLGILVEKEDKSGRVVISFDCDEFLEDVATLCDAKPLNQKDITQYKARKFLSRFGLDVVG